MKTEKINYPVYITKYALTRGVLVYQGGESIKLDPNTPQARLLFRPPGEHSYSILYSEDDFYTNKSAAMSKVAQMIQKKRKALTKQLQKLDELEKSVPFIEKAP